MANKMSITPEVQNKRLNALKSCIEKYEIRNKDFIKGGFCNYSSEISEFKDGRTLTDPVVYGMYEAVFKDKGVRIEYLLGTDDYMTERERQQDLSQMRDDISKTSMEANQATMFLLDYALKGVYLDKELTRLKATGLTEKEALKKLAKVSPPENMIEPADALFLMLQLQEEAEKLVWSYLHRSKSPLWSFLDK